MAPQLEWSVRGSDDSVHDVEMRESGGKLPKISLRSGIYGNSFVDEGDVSYYWLNALSAPHSDVIIYSKLPNSMKWAGYAEVKEELHNLLVNVISGKGLGEVKKIKFSFCYPRCAKYHLFPNWAALFKMLSPCPVVPKNITLREHEIKSVCEELIGNSLEARLALRGYDPLMRNDLHFVDPDADEVVVEEGGRRNNEEMLEIE